MKRIWTVFILLLCLFLVSCRGEQPAGGPERGYMQISQEEARKMMERDDGHVIVDVRSREEYDEGHIPGAILIPNEEIGTQMPEQLPDPDQIILIYCRSGNRSKQAAKKLAEMGYANLYEFGGINTWDGEIVKEENKPENGEPAVLYLPSFDGGGPVFSASAEDPEIVSVELTRDYGGDDPALVDGASYTAVITFTGLKEGETRVTVSARSPITENSDTVYLVCVDGNLKVSLTQISYTDLDNAADPLPELVLEANGKRLYADFEDNASAQALCEVLSREGRVEVRMHDYGDFEKVGDLPWDLPRSDEHITTRPGDVILYQGNQITVYYDENTWNFTRVARISGKTREQMLEFLGESDVSVSFWVEWGE